MAALFHCTTALIVREPALLIFDASWPVGRAPRVQNGWIDIAEAKAAMRTAQTAAAAATAERDRKAHTAALLRQRAAKKAQQALRPPRVARGGGRSARIRDASESGSESGELSAAADGAAESGGRAGRLANSFFSARASEARERRAAEAERKRRAAERARQALQRMGHREMARGWQGWIEWHEHRQWCHGAPQPAPTAHIHTYVTR